MLQVSLMEDMDRRNTVCLFNTELRIKPLSQAFIMFYIDLTTGKDTGFQHIIDIHLNV